MLVNTLFGMTNKFCPFFAVPDSTFPITTVPISLYLSTIGIMNGPSVLRFNDGRSSINGMKAGPSYHGQVDASMGFRIPWPVIPDTGMNVKSFALKLHCIRSKKQDEKITKNSTVGSFLPKFLQIWKDLVFAFVVALHIPVNSWIVHFIN